MPPKSSGLRSAVAIPDDLREEDLLFGQLLVRKKFCTQEQVKECLHLQDQARKAIPQSAPRLGDILIRKGYIGLAQAEEVLRLREQIVVLNCPKCGANYRLIEADPKKKYVCKKTVDGAVCGTVLRHPGASTSVAAAAHSSFSLRPLPPEVREAAQDERHVFGKYVLVKEIGRGGMGAVYKGYDTSLSRMVALKFLLGEQSGPSPSRVVGEETDEVKRFLREAQTAASISHPNICQIYEVGQDQGRHFIAMQYIEGHNLVGHKIPARRAAELIRTVALALDHAHEVGIVHRDIKPHNIMLDPAGKPFVMDFGLAKSIKGKSSLTQTGMVMGTPSYMSPEQAEGDIRNINRRTDVYALGATLYELLTGRPPFDGKNPFEVMTKVVNEDPPPPGRRCKGLPHDLEVITLKAMEKDRSRRYGSAKELADDLGRFLAGEPIQARAVSVVGRLGKRVSRNKANMVPIFVAAALVLVGLVTWGVISSQSAAEFQAAKEQADARWAKQEYKEALPFYTKAGLLRPDDVEIAKRIKSCKEEMANAEARVREEGEKRTKAEEEKRLAAEKAKRDAEKATRESEGQRLAEEKRRKEEEEKRKVAEAETAKLAEAQKASREGKSKAEPSYAKGKQDLDDAMKDFYRKGADLVQTRARLQSAIDNFTKAIDLCPLYHEALTERGRARTLRFEYDAAEADFTKALAATPDYLPAVVERGRLCAQRYIEALIDVGWITSGEVTARFEPWRKKASADFQKAVSLGAEHQKPAFEAFLAFAERRLPECIQRCDEALKANPSQEDVLKLLGDARHFTLTNAIAGHLRPDQMEVARQAEDAYSKAIDLRVNFYEAILMRGHERHFIGDEESAKSDFEGALRLRPDDSLACWMMGGYYNNKAEAGDASAYPTAVEWYSRGLKSKPDSFINLINRGVALGNLQKYDEAVKDLEAALKINPAHAHGWYMKGAILGRLGRSQDALAALQESVKRDPSFYSSWYNIGAILANMGRRQEAIDAFQKSIDRGHPNKAAIQKIIDQLRGGG